MFLSILSTYLWQITGNYFQQFPNHPSSFPIIHYLIAKLLNVILLIIATLITYTFPLVRMFQWNICKDVIAARGPDHLTEKHISLNHHWHGHFATAVLWMQGSEIITQPSLDDNNNLLLWNGDIFSGCLVRSIKLYVCTKYFWSIL